MKASSFDKKLDEGKDIINLLDLKTARRPGLEMGCVDKEAHRVGVTHQALIKLWLADKLIQG